MIMMSSHLDVSRETVSALMAMANIGPHLGSRVSMQIVDAADLEYLG